MKSLVISLSGVRGIIGENLTPDVLSKLAARGGICITASHNPPEWNGLKFYNSQAILLSSSMAKNLLSTYERSRITAEAKTKKKASQIYKMVASLIKNEVNTQHEH